MCVSFPLRSPWYAATELKLLSMRSCAHCTSQTTGSTQTTFRVRRRALTVQKVCSLVNGFVANRELMVVANGVEYSTRLENGKLAARMIALPSPPKRLDSTGNSYEWHRQSDSASTSPSPISESMSLVSDSDTSPTRSEFPRTALAWLEPPRPAL